MDNTIPVLIQAINSIPRQFFANTNNDLSGSKEARLASQLIFRYRRQSDDLARVENIQPVSEIIKRCCPAENEDTLSVMLKQIIRGIPVNSDPTPTIFIEHTGKTVTFSQKMLIGINSKMKIYRGAFYWDLFKINLLMDKLLYPSAAYFITNQEASAIEKKIAAYYEHNFYVSCNAAKNLFFLLKKSYDSDVIVLDSKGRIIG